MVTKVFILFHWHLLTLISFPNILFGSGSMNENVSGIVRQLTNNYVQVILSRFFNANVLSRHRELIIIKCFYQGHNWPLGTIYESNIICRKDKRDTYHM